MSSSRSIDGSLADPLHVAIDGDLAQLDDLAALDLHEARAVGGPMVLAAVRERRGDAPRVEVLQALERLSHRVAGRVGARALDGLDREERVEPPAHVGRGMRVVRMVLLVE